jgi:hypothetical protein
LFEFIEEAFDKVSAAVGAGAGSMTPSSRYSLFFKIG